MRPASARRVNPPLWSCQGKVVFSWNLGRRESSPLNRLASTQSLPTEFLVSRSSEIDIYVRSPSSIGSIGLNSAPRSNGALLTSSSAFRSRSCPRCAPNFQGPARGVLIPALIPEVKKGRSEERRVGEEGARG